MFIHCLTGRWISFGDTHNVDQEAMRRTMIRRMHNYIMSKKKIISLTIMFEQTFNGAGGCKNKGSKVASGDVEDRVM